MRPRQQPQGGRVNRIPGFREALLGQYQYMPLSARRRRSDEMMVSPSEVVEVARASNLSTTPTTFGPAMPATTPRPTALTILVPTKADFVPSDDASGSAVFSGVEAKPPPQSVFNSIPALAFDVNEVRNLRGVETRRRQNSPQMVNVLYSENFPHSLP